jgi:type VI secretion system secreted protein VgrG
MSDGFSQTDRMVRLKTHLGDKDLVIDEMNVDEGINRLFRIDIECDGARDDIDLKGCIGKEWKIECHVRHEGRALIRYFHGVVGEARYGFVLRPRLYLGSLGKDIRVNHDIAANMLVDRYLKRYEETYTIQMAGNPIITHTQYEESDFDYISRFMQVLGVNYFYAHNQDRYEPTFCDNDSRFIDSPAMPKTVFAPSQPGDGTTGLRIWSMVPERRHDKAHVTLGHYRRQEPKADMRAEAEYGSDTTIESFEWHSADTRYTSKEAGVTLAEFERDAIAAERRLIPVAGNCIVLEPGTKTTVTGHGDPAMNKSYLVVHARHRFSGQSTRSGAKGARGTYMSSFDFLDAAITYRPLHTTPKPRIHGVQTAHVIDRKQQVPDDEKSPAPTEEIDVDEDGLILVRFNWRGRADDTTHRNTSRRVRVAQMWAGAGWGTQFIPRVGMEVVVNFLNGDPDMPLVVGAVYHADNNHPYELEAKKTQSGIKTRSTKDGKGYNELMFEDKKGSELVRFQAERNLQSLVKANETRTVGANRRTTIRKDDDLTIEGDLTIDVLGESVYASIGKINMASVGSSVDIEALTSITLTCGASTIKMTPVGIEINTINFKHTSISYEQNWINGLVSGVVANNTVPITNHTGVMNVTGVVKSVAFVGTLTGIYVPAPIV